MADPRGEHFGDGAGCGGRQRVRCSVTPAACIASRGWSDGHAGLPRGALGLFQAWKSLVARLVGQAAGHVPALYPVPGTWLGPESLGCPRDGCWLGGLPAVALFCRLCGAQRGLQCGHDALAGSSREWPDALLMHSAGICGGGLHLCGRRICFTTW